MTGQMVGPSVTGQMEDERSRGMRRTGSLAEEVLASSGRQSAVGDSLAAARDAYTNRRKQLEVTVCIQINELLILNDGFCIQNDMDLYSK